MAKHWRKVTTIFMSKRPIFSTTNHCRKRMQERGLILDLNMLNFGPVGKKLKVKIQEKCKVNGYQANRFDYWATTVDTKKIILVSKLIHTGEHKVITIFEIEST